MLQPKMQLLILTATDRRYTMVTDFETWYTSHYIAIKQDLDKSKYLTESDKALVLMSHRQGAELAWEAMRNA